MATRRVFFVGRRLLLVLREAVLRVAVLLDLEAVERLELELFAPFRDPAEALPPLRPAAARFAEVEPAEAFPPLRAAMLRFAELEPPEALPPLRPAAARLAEVELFDDFADFEPEVREDDFEDLLAERFAADFPAPPLRAPPLLAPPFFAPFDALFFAAILFLLSRKVSGGEPYFLNQ